MDSRKRKPNLNPCPPSPLPNPPLASTIFRDISNLKTPKKPIRTPGFKDSPQFFTAAKNTPSSSVRRGYKTSALKSKAARRLKAFEIEQSKSARKAQSEKEQSLKTLSRSFTVWLNFLFENPSSCGCDPASFTGEIDSSDSSLGGGIAEVLVNNGKRESGPGQRVGIDGPWRGPKRQRDLLWKGEGNDELGKSVFSDSMLSGLRSSLQEICSFEDLKERMRMYLSLASCNNILKMMAQVTKNIDEGRLKMRASCPIVSDVGMKEKALKTLMCYNPIWLRIGLYIILGGDSLLPNGDVNSEQENTFLRMVLEKQFFSHTGLAKAHAYNKMVEGLYRPGYYEKLGNVILKRFLLLVIVIDRAKSQTSIPLKYGIDGVDGGSPPLFSSKSVIKSSRQLIVDFLSSDVMHGEGNLLAHLVIVGYKVTYQQNPLMDYDFKVVGLFEDLRDGVRLCRAIELLKHDSSILMKVVVPSDTQKKSLVNCGIALQYLKQAGVPLFDEDGTEIIGEDVVNGDKELTLSLLWNIFVHLQLPLLINKALLSEEISNIRGGLGENSSTQTLLDLLISWVQAICETYELKIESHSSLLDGKAMWCLLDYYFRKEHNCSCSSKDPGGTRGESIMSVIEYTDAVHNFILSQKLTSLLGNFPEVLQVSDIIEHNGASNGQSVIVLLAFLSAQLLVKRNMDKLNFHKLLGFSCPNTNSRLSNIEWDNVKDPTRDFKAIMAWWQDMAQQTGKCSIKSALLADRNSSTVQRENAAIIIQSHFRRLVEHRNYKRISNAALVLQTVVLAWLSVKKKVSMKELRAKTSHTARGEHLEKFGTYVTFMSDRHYFVKLKKSIRLIQRAVRAWIAKRHCKTGSVMSREDRVYDLWTTAAVIVQRTWKDYVSSKSIRTQHFAVTKIQSHFRRWLMKKNLTCKKQAVVKIQRSFRCSKCRKEIRRCKEENVAAIIIQSHVRGWMARKQAYREKKLFIRIQSLCRGWLQRKQLLHQKDAAIKIQSAIRHMNCHELFVSQRHAAIDIQRFIRGENTRKRILGASKQHRFKGLELKICVQSIVKLQRWWRHVLQVRAKTKSAVVIQSHFRKWILRQTANRQNDRAVVIQSYWRGYVARKHARDQLLDLRLRMQKSAANVDESRRLINRLVAALSELLSMRSVSNIMHTCATLDMATELSQKCCEELVAAGAIGTLLKLIRSVSRSIPDQQVLKHALSTLRNLARYPALAEILVGSQGCMETVILEFLRNKEEGYFIASELLKRICASKNGVNAIRKSPAFLKRLNSLAEELARKAGNDKRNARNLVARENGERRLKEVVELLKLIANA
ncbi:abnormal spindle-like microcephaly-associated protein homolog [Phtheirospermum japonicum]|uniref:Abnormal spindle-like microcephaly-associated protein homolog n=1 Tax=Phtheirospermum japonicum TaxID=374723 RepID=A0A830CCV7_9LAMI|nr:abnormal spindle-like microcephaly-associated protein homolog [Phtheirospermum japonicum]